MKAIASQGWGLNPKLVLAGFEHTDDAYARSKSGRARGKVVVKL